MTKPLKLPCGECRGKCCTYPAFSPRELKTVKKKYKIPIDTKIIEFQNSIGTYLGKGISLIKANGNCTFLSPEGQCTIYDLRPRVCKLYGEIKALPCMYLFPTLKR